MASQTRIGPRRGGAAARPARRRGRLLGGPGCPPPRRCCGFSSSGPPRGDLGQAPARAASRFSRRARQARASAIGSGGLRRYYRRQRGPRSLALKHRHRSTEFPCMYRNLDLAALRALVAVVDLGGVTGRGAAQPHAVGGLDADEAARGDARCVPDGTRGARRRGDAWRESRLVGYARRLLALNDEVVVRMGPATAGGEICASARPATSSTCTCRRCCATMPSGGPTCGSSSSPMRAGLLRERLDAGATRPDHDDGRRAGPGAETLDAAPLVWIGAPGGRAWRAPAAAAGDGDRLRLLAGSDRTAGRTAISTGCWRSSVEDRGGRGGGGGPGGLHDAPRDRWPAGFEAIDHRGALPGLPRFGINMDRHPGAAAPDRGAARRRGAGAPMPGPGRSPPNSGADSLSSADECN